MRSSFLQDFDKGSKKQPADIKILFFQPVVQKGIYHDN